MPKRKVVWRPSDIREWGGPRASLPTTKATSPALPLDTELSVQIGQETHAMKLAWFADLLSEAELAELSTAIAHGQELKLKATARRAAIRIAKPDQSPA